MNLDYESEISEEFKEEHINNTINFDNYFRKFTTLNLNKDAYNKVSHEENSLGLLKSKFDNNSLKNDENKLN